MFNRNLLFFTISAFVVGGCNSPTSSDDKLYPIKGKIVSIDASEKKVKIDHEDIPGLMKAMTMTFSVDDAKLLEGLAVGTQVEGKVKHVDVRYVITELKALGTAKAKDKDKDIREALAKLSPEDRALAEAQKTCPQSGQPLGSMDVPVKLTVKGKPVFICCEGCRDAVESKNK